MLQIGYYLHININNGNATGHTYEAYQIFKGDLRWRYLIKYSMG